MVSPEQVVRCVERAEQDITAISDTVLDIKETVGGHTQELAAIRSTLDDHGRKLETLDGRMDSLVGRLDTLESKVTEGFAEILRRLDAH